MFRTLHVMQAVLAPWLQRSIAGIVADYLPLIPEITVGLRCWLAVPRSGADPPSQHAYIFKPHCVTALHFDREWVELREATESGQQPYPPPAGVGAAGWPLESAVSPALQCCQPAADAVELEDW